MAPFGSFKGKKVSGGSRGQSLQRRPSSGAGTKKEAFDRAGLSVGPHESLTSPPSHSAALSSQACS